MANWHESDYIDCAKKLAAQYAVSSRPINELAEKVAREEGMNPDEIRTLVRLTNVEVFRKLFNDNQGSDRMIEFPPGDPETLIQQMQAEASAPPMAASIGNDKLASFDIPDFTRDIRHPVNQEEMSKVASLNEERKPVDPRFAIERFRKLRDEFSVSKIAANQQWEIAVNELAAEARKMYFDYDGFEKDAFATHGEDVVVEINTLRRSTRRTPFQGDLSKLAAFTARHLVLDSKRPAMQKLAAAVARRNDYIKLSNGIEWLDAQLRAAGAK